MKAMIMAAGQGTRLLPLTADTPKPMLPIGGKPLIEHIISLLREHDFTEIIANLHYLPDKIRDYFGDGSRFGVKLFYSPEPELLGTAGGVRRCTWFLAETFLVISGDALTNIDLTSFYEYHLRKGALATIALKKVQEVSQYGVVITDNEGRINQFQEKPKHEEAFSDLANTGIYIFEPEILNLIPEMEFYDFGKQLFPLLVDQQQKFYGWKTDCYWCDIGAIDIYQQAKLDWDLGFLHRKTKFGLG